MMVLVGRSGAVTHGTGMQHYQGTSIFSDAYEASHHFVPKKKNTDSIWFKIKSQIQLSKQIINTLLIIYQTG